MSSHYFSLSSFLTCSRPSPPLGRKRIAARRYEEKDQGPRRRRRHGRWRRLPLDRCLDIFYACFPSILSQKSTLLWQVRAQRLGRRGIACVTRSDTFSCSLRTIARRCCSSPAKIRASAYITDIERLSLSLSLTHTHLSLSLSLSHTRSS